MPLLLFIIAFALCSCAGTTKVVESDYTGATGTIDILHKNAVVAVAIDNKHVGNTPLRVELPVGEHRVVMNYGGKIVFDSTITVQDDYERNSAAMRMGGIVAGFASILLISAPAGIIIAPIPFLIGELGSDVFIPNVRVSSMSGYNAVATVRPDSNRRDSVLQITSRNAVLQDSSQDTLLDNDSVTDSAEVPASSSFQNSDIAMYPMSKYGFLVREREKSEFSSVRYAKSMCYSETDDLVWVAALNGVTSVLQREDVIPCELDSLPYPTKSSRIKAGAISFLTTTGIWGGIGLVAGGSLTSALIGGMAGSLFFGTPALLITNAVVDSKNKKKCEYLRRKDEVKDWFRKFPCQKTNPKLESKNQ